MSPIAANYISEGFLKNTSKIFETVISYRKITKIKVFFRGGHQNLLFPRRFTNRYINMAFWAHHSSIGQSFFYKKTHLRSFIVVSEAYVLLLHTDLYYLIFLKPYHDRIEFLMVICLV